MFLNAYTFKMIQRFSDIHKLWIVELKKLID